MEFELVIQFFEILRLVSTRNYRTNALQVTAARKRTAGIHRVGGGPASGTVWTRWGTKHSCHYQDSNSDPSVLQPVATR
jgi:hypothetical protein